MIILGNKVTTINYLDGNSLEAKVSTPFIEGLVKTSVNFEDGSNEDENYFISNNYAINKMKVASEETFSQIKDLYMPLKYKVMDKNFIPLGEFVPLKANKYSLGVVSEIETNLSHDIFRFNLLNTKWSNGSSLKAKDFAFGISKHLDVNNASSSSRYLYQYSDIKGIDEVFNSFKTEERDLDNNPNNGFYGLTKTANNFFLEASSKEEANEVTQKFYGLTEGPGIIYYDSVNNEEKSFIQFNLNHPNELFPSLLVSPAFMPLNQEWWYKQIGFDKPIWNFGYSENTFLSNGPYQLKKFDSLYGFEAEKNNYYRYANLVSSKKIQYRVTKEISTSLSNFNNDNVSYVFSNNKDGEIIRKNKKAKVYLNKSLTSPSTTFIVFNLNKTNSSNASLYYRDPNFRRAFFYAFNQNDYYNFQGINNLLGTTTFSPTRTFSYDNQDLIDYACDINYQHKNISQKESLEYYSLESRKNKLKENQLSKDPSVNIKLANYYWEIFLSDMEQLGLPLPSKEKPLNLTFATKDGQSDYIYHSLVHSLSNPALNFSQEVTFTLDVDPTASYWNKYHNTDDWDLTSQKISLDFLDSWNFLRVFNKKNNDRSINVSNSWTYWNGSDYSFDNNLYNNPNLARKLFNDGISSFYDNSNNFSMITYQGKELSKNVIDTVDNFMIFLLEKNNIFIKNHSELESFFTTKNSLINGISYYEYDSFQNQFQKLIIYLTLELIIKNSVPIIVVNNELSFSNPNHIYFEGNTLTGEKTWIIAFDWKKLKNDNYWKEVLKNV